MPSSDAYRWRPGNWTVHQSEAFMPNSFVPRSRLFVTVAVRFHLLRQARWTFCVVPAASVSFDLHAGNIRFGTENEKWISVRTNIQMCLTLALLTWRIWWAPTNASKWQMGFNSAFKGLMLPVCLHSVRNKNILKIIGQLKKMQFTTFSCWCF